MANNSESDWFATLMRYDSSNPEVEECAFVYRLDQDTLIGREVSCQIVLDSGMYSTVSRRHAKVIRMCTDEEKPIWQICDLNSTNGTYVNGAKVTACQTLKHGDHILFSKVGPEFIFEYCPAVTQPPPTALTGKTSVQKPPTPQAGAKLLGLRQQSLAPPETALSSFSHQLTTPAWEDNSVLSPRKSLWSVVTHPDFQTFSGHKSPVQGMAFSPDNTRLASGGADTTIRLWDLEAGREIGQLAGHLLGVNTVAFSPNRLFLASGGEDQAIKFWDLKTGQEVSQLVGHQSAVKALAFSPTSQILASGGADNAIKLWDLRTREVISTLNGSQLAVNALAFSPDGLTLASGGADMTIHLWKLETQEIISSFSPARAVVKGVMFSPDSQLLMVSSADQTIRLWNFEAAQVMWALAGPRWQVGGVAISPDGRRFAGCDATGAIKVWGL
ncbi:MAG: FHA domain-containing protein [Leptolyngbyaceae cyanobacterium MO_188.B28]|nr:FHA domain-containing protein [Leptolyngbyaceae cyanobacterium MO_188.B28]